MLAVASITLETMIVVLKWHVAYCYFVMDACDFAANHKYVCFVWLQVSRTPSFTEAQMVPMTAKLGSALQFGTYVKFVLQRPTEQTQLQPKQNILKEMMQSRSAQHPLLKKESNNRDVLYNRLCVVIRSSGAVWNSGTIPSGTNYVILLTEILWTVGIALT